MRTTGIERKPADEFILMKATSVPDVGAPGPTETIKERGVVPLVGVTTSQLLLENVVTLTLTDPAEDVTSTV